MSEKPVSESRPLDDRLSRSRLRRRKAWVRLLVVMAGVAGVYVAARVLSSFSLGGPLSQQLVTASFIAAVLHATEFCVHRVLRRVLGGAARTVVMSHALAPVQLWLAVWCGKALGLPVELTGFWPTVAASLLIIAVGTVVVSGSLIVVVGLQYAYRRSTAGTLINYVATLGVLWLAVAALDGVRLEPGPVVAQLLTTAVVTAVVMPFTFPSMIIGTGFTGPLGSRLTGPLRSAVGVLAGVAVVNITMAGLALWALSWLSTWTPITLSISGFWTFLLTALLMTMPNSTQ